MKITKAVIIILIFSVLSCSVRVKPYPATQRLTFKVPVTLAIELSKIPEKAMVSGSVCVWLFNFGSKAYEVHLREGFQSGAEYSLIDFAEKIETVTGSTAGRTYDIIYQPELTDFRISPFLETTINVKVKVMNSNGTAVIDKQITGVSKNSGMACVMGFIGNIFFQSLALEMSVKSALESYYEQLYVELVNNSELKKLQERKDSVGQSDSNTEKNVIVVLKDGSEIVGVIVSQDEGVVTVRTKYTTMKVKKDKIEIINYKK